MIMFVTAVYDRKVNAYMNPQFFRTKGEAIRAWMDAVRSEGNPFKRNAEDYVFFHLGYYDDGDGKFGAPPNEGGLPEPIMSAADCLVIEGSVN